MIPCPQSIGGREKSVVISCVEPPSWWRRTAQKSVRLLLRGEGLGDAPLQIDGQGVRLGASNVSPDGRTLFVDLFLAPDAPIGPRNVRLGDAKISFTVLDRAAPCLGPLSETDVLYLILPDRFYDGDPKNNDPEKSKGLFDKNRPRHYHGGDLVGIRQKLPYLKQLGVTALWLTPLYDNADIPHPTLRYAGQPAIDYHGYGAVNFYALEEHFGTPDDLHALISEAHRLKIKILQDQVANHVGPLHPWAADPPTPTWLHPKIDCDWNVKNVVDPQASAASKRATLSGWFAGILPDLNQDDPECRRYLIQNALWWVGVFGFDGIRQDTAPYVPVDFWQGWHAALRAEFPKISTLGEVNFPDPEINAHFDRRGAGFSHLYDFALFEVLIGKKPLSALGEVLAKDTLYADPENLVTFLGLHDEPRFLGRDGASLEQLKLAATFLFTTRGIPLWYYGDEVGLSGGGDPDNRRSFPKEKFTPEGRTPEENSLWEHVQSLIRLRKTLPALRKGKTTVIHAGNKQLLYSRTLGKQVVFVALNAARRAVRLSAGGREWQLPAISGKLSVEKAP